MKENIKISRFGVCYLPRKMLEDGIDNKIKITKKKLSKAKKEKNIDGKEINFLLKKIESLTSNRPCIIIKIYKGNVTIIPLTRSDADESHLEIKSQSTNNKKSYAKISVIKTYSRQKFVSRMEWAGNKRLNREEIDNLLEAMKKHYAN